MTGRCGAQAVTGSCLLPAGHNMGQVDIPENHDGGGTGMTTAARIEKVCDDLKAMLLAKNAAYGDSASNPLRVFSKADKLEAIRVRIDDKLSRISRGHGYPGDNDVRDLIGYLLLYLANDGTLAGQGEPTPQASKEHPVRYLDAGGDLWYDVGESTYVRGEPGGMNTIRNARWTREFLDENWGPLKRIEG